MDDTTHKSTGSLLSDAMANVSGLVRSEVDLARAEVSENLEKAGVALGVIAGGVVIVIVALNVLAAALVAALTEAGLNAGLAALIVGVALAVAAYLMVKKGIGDLKLSSLAPTRTAKNVRRDATAVKEVYDVK